MTFLSAKGTITLEMEVKTLKKLICFILAATALLSACAAPAPQPPTDPTEPSATTAPPVTDPPVTEPPVTVPPVTEPPPTEPPVDPPEPFIPHEKFDAAACAELLGTWTATITLDNDLQKLEAFNAKTAFTLYYTFEEDGHFFAWVEEEGFENAIDSYETAMIEHMVTLQYQTFYGLLEYQGVAPEVIESRWKNGPEAEARAECADSVAALNLYHRFKRLLRDGQYYVEGGKLYTQLSEVKFEANSFTAGKTKLTLRTTDNRGTYRDICVDFPLVFEKFE